MTEMKLSPGRAERTHGCTDYRAWLAVGRRLRGTGYPFKGVLQYPRNRKIIFRHGKDQRIGCRYFFSQLLDRRRKAALLDIGAVEWHVGQARNGKAHAF